jgi:hypothetical protein
MGPAARRKRISLVVFGLILSVLGTSCTGQRTREFTRESYDPPPELAPVARVFEAPRPRVWASLLEVLRGRGARLDWTDAEAGTLVGALPWAGVDEAKAAVALGVVHKVVTRTERTYRSYSPLDFRCNECVVRNGKITSERIELIEDLDVGLDPSRYRIEAVLRAGVAEVAEGTAGTRVELSLDLKAVPPEPPGLLPRSTGHLEAVLLDSLAESLESRAAVLR